jgi:hypothetical protein
MRDFFFDPQMHIFYTEGSEARMPPSAPADHFYFDACGYCGHTT